MNPRPKHGLNRRCVLTLPATLLTTSAPLALAGPAGGSADFSWLDALLRDRVDRGLFDGLGLVLGQGAQVVHQAHFGLSHPGRVRHVASTGKWVAAATIASVVDSGPLRWSDPAKRYVPQLRGSMGDATLRQLLSHTAGYPDYQPAGRPRDDYDTLQDAVAHIVDLPAVSAPGERFQYGGLAMQVAGRMAEIAAGTDFPTLFHQRLGTPLGMQLSGFSPVSKEGGFSPMLGGSFFTCTLDLSRFLAMVASDGRHNGRQLLSRAALRELQADQVRGAALKPGEFVAQARQDLRRDVYGLGQWREEVAADGEPTLLSSPGWAGAYAWVDRKAGVWGAVVGKANLATCRAEGYSTFLGSTVYAPMARRAVLEARQPPKARRVRLPDGTRLYYEESGSGPAVVLLHGHSLDLRQWDAQVPALSRHYRVLRYDLRGYGRSDLPREDQPFLHADDLAALLDELQIERAHLVGLSLGGSVAVDFLARHPRRARSALMAGGDLFDMPGPDSPWTPETLRSRQEAIATLKAGGLYAAKMRWFEGLINGSGSRREQLRQPLWRMIDEWSGWQLTHAEPRLLLGRAAPAALQAARPRMPVLLLRGDRESQDYPIRQLLPQATVSVIPDCGHLSSMERPAEFNERLLSFLQSVRD